MRRYLLDARFCAHVLKHHPAALRDRFNAEADGLCLSALTLADLLFAAETTTRAPANRLAIDHFAARLDILSFSATAAAQYGVLRAELERSEYDARPGDLLLAAQARADGLVIVSTDPGAYDGMTGVRVESWG